MPRVTWSLAGLAASAVTCIDNERTSSAWVAIASNCLHPALPSAVYPVVWRVTGLFGGRAISAAGAAEWADVALAVAVALT